MASINQSVIFQVWAFPFALIHYGNVSEVKLHYIQLTNGLDLRL